MKKAVVLSLVAALAGPALAETPLRIKSLKVMCVVYRGAEDAKDRLDDKAVTQIKNGFELGRLFYYRNSKARLNTELEWMIFDTAAPENAGPTMDNFVADLRKRGVHARERELARDIFVLRIDDDDGRIRKLRGHGIDAGHLQQSLCFAHRPPPSVASQASPQAFASSRTRRI